MSSCCLLTIAPVSLAGSSGDPGRRPRDALRHPGDEIVVAVPVHQQPRGRAAGLALPGEVHPRIAPSTARSRSASGKTTIGFFPPSSSVTVFTLAAGGAGLDAPPGGGAADEGDPGDARMPDQRVPDLGAEAGQDLHHARREQPLQVLGHRQRRQRGELGRLEYHAVAGQQRRGDLGAGEHQRVVERDDPGGHAERLAARCSAAGRGFPAWSGRGTSSARPARYLIWLVASPMSLRISCSGLPLSSESSRASSSPRSLDRVGEGEQRGRPQLGLGRPPAGAPPASRPPPRRRRRAASQRGMGPMTLLVAGLMTSRVAPETAPTRSPSTRAGLSVASTG